MSHNKMKCKYCNKEFIPEKLNWHLKNDHINIYKEQIELIKKLFYDVNFSEMTLDQYPQIILNFNTIYNIWQNIYTAQERYERMNKCRSLHNKDGNTDQFSAKNICNQVSKKINKYAGKYRTIQGFRPDIGHSTRSTYEANIYRIFQKEKKQYKYENENTFPIIFPDGTQHNYIIDICDVEGLFAEAGTYIEVKGYMDEKSIIKINSFREQYPQYKLITIGKRLKCEHSYIYDIDYNELEQKYKDLIPLWETSIDNIRTNSKKWNINTNINYISNYSNEKIELIKQLFYDKNFTRVTIKQYNNEISNIGYTTIYREWLKIFGKDYVKNRTKILKPNKIKELKAFIDCPICGKVHSKWLFTHIKDNHEELYNSIMKIIKELFYDSNFVQDHIDQYKDILYGINYTTIYTQWKKNIWRKSSISTYNIIKTSTIFKYK